MKRGMPSANTCFLVWIALQLAILVVLLSVHFAHAHDHTRPDLNGWFSGLHSEQGLCCDGTDIDTGKARHVATEDWDTKDGHYRVRLDGEWIDVPDNAVIHQPNLYGETLVWPVKGYDGVWIRCFLPGSMT